MSSNEHFLSVNNVEVIYDHVILVLKGVSLEVPEEGIVALLGANGAGKTTTLKSISNLLGSERGVVTKGAIDYQGARIDGLTPSELVKRGVIQVMEGRHCFEHLTVEENLLTGGYTRGGDRKGVADDLELVYNYFPRLKDRLKSLAGYISGGEQQMVAIGRALMANPKILLLDEVSLGLAPVIIRDIYKALPGIVGGGMSAVIVEQDITKALAVSSRVYCLQEGRVSLEGRSDTVSRDEIARAYFGVE